MPAIQHRALPIAFDELPSVRLGPRNRLRGMDAAKCAFEPSKVVEIRPVACVIFVRICNEGVTNLGAILRCRAQGTLVARGRVLSRLFASRYLRFGQPSDRRAFVLALRSGPG